MPEQPITTYRNAKKYGFCPGCSHGLILNALDKALVRLQWAPAEVVLVTDIGCVGLSDQYFTTSAFHGLHGRSLTYAAGIKLARPELHVIALIGDGGCGIGGAHLLNAARRNIGVTTLVFNNLNFGMTGGQHSVATPPEGVTATTPWGNLERPLDIAQTVAINGAGHVWRGTAFEKDLDARIEAALTYDGFALLDIWELCVAYYAASNNVNPKALVATMEALGLQAGLLHDAPRPEYAAALRAQGASQHGKPAAQGRPLPTRYPPPLDRRYTIVVAGSAGGRVRTAAKMIGLAATLSGLWATQRDDYPVTVRSGHSISELVLAPEEVRYTGVTVPDALFILSADGYHKTAHYLRTMPPTSRVFVVPEFADVATSAQKTVLDPETLTGVPRNNWMLGLVAAGLGRLGLFDPEALLEAAAGISAAYADQNRAAVAAVLQA